MNTHTYNTPRAAFSLELTPTGAPDLLCPSNLISNMNEKLGSGCQTLNCKHFIAFIIHKLVILLQLFSNVHNFKLCLQITLKWQLQK